MAATGAVHPYPIALVAGWSDTWSSFSFPIQ
jgi:hypothetical protein